MTREKFISNILKNIFYQHEKVLDLGAGCCKVAKQLKNDYQVNITCLDIENHNKTELKLQVYKGKNIPFTDNEFDKTMLLFTLHHSNNPIQLLKEATRVTNNKLIILEDTYSNIFEYIFTITADFLINLKHPNNFHIKNYNTDKDWQKIFTKLNLKITKTQILNRQNINFGQHVLYVLKKS